MLDAASLRFDHLVIGARDLGASLRVYRDDLGFDLRLAGRHTGKGTHNAIARFGLDYLELIAVHDAAEAEGAGRGVLASFLRDHQGGFVSYALATAALDSLAQRVRAAGLDSVGPFPMERLRPDGTRVTWRLFWPGGQVYRAIWPFFIQWDEPDDVRLRRETPGDHPNGALALDEIAVAVADLSAAAALYHDQLGLTLEARFREPDQAAECALFRLANCRLVLLAPSGPGPIADELASRGQGPYQAVLTVRSLEQTRQWLVGRGTSLKPAPGVPGGLLIDQARFSGTRLVFR